MLRRILLCIKYLARRRTACLLPLLIWSILMLVTFYWLGEGTSRALLPPPPPDQNLDHFRRSRELQHYLDNINLLIEPSSPCVGAAPPALVLVSSAPAHAARRRAVRASWGRRLTTYFVLGLQAGRLDGTLTDNYVEAKQYSDLIVYDFPDHYQNLTLKTMLMLQWTLQRCPRAEYLLKTDDDVLINPWTLQKVMEKNPGAKLLGWRGGGAAALHRDAYNKWFVPRWLRTDARVAGYLSGTAYLINGNYIRDILLAAKKVPLINLEDVYLTYLVAKSKLNLELVHDRRLSPYKPWVPLDCAYWTLASIHSLTPTEMSHAWARVERVAREYESDKGVCSFYTNHIEHEMLLF